MIRDEVERIVKEFSLDRSKIFEVSKQKYKDILTKTEHTFVKKDAGIHWANMGYFKAGLEVTYIQCDEMWYENLEKIIPPSEHSFYVFLEESGRQKPKYWVYEMGRQEIITVIGETSDISDFYIVSKKFEWLISENHHMVISFIGDKLDLSSVQRA